jgi:hypothetical protein
MRYIAYGIAIFVVVFALALASGQLPREATALHNETNGTMNVLELEQTNGAKALPDRTSLTRSIGSSPP